MANGQNNAGAAPAQPATGISPKVQQAMQEAQAFKLPGAPDADQTIAALEATRNGDLDRAWQIIQGEAKNSSLAATAANIPAAKMGISEGEKARTISNLQGVDTYNDGILNGVKAGLAQAVAKNDRDGAFKLESFLLNSQLINNAAVTYNAHGQDRDPHSLDDFKKLAGDAATAAVIAYAKAPNLQKWIPVAGEIDKHIDAVLPPATTPEAAGKGGVGTPNH